MYKKTIASCFVVAALSLALPVGAGDDSGQLPPKPGAKERCAVCGMYVAKYPQWVAVVETNDGRRFYFDGPKDMFRFLQDLTKYGLKGDQIKGIWVTDYYSTHFVPARDALFVVGSDVSGPMGAELVPVMGAASAKAFKADHNGTAVLRFDEVGPEQMPH